MAPPATHGSGGAGGVLLKAKDITISSAINVLGGGGDSVNGGTVKIFPDNSPATGGISKGRGLKCNYNGSGCSTY